MKTNIYVDGFNLYYGYMKDSPYKWLNIQALCQTILPAIVINRIRYFTALVSARTGDPDQPVRQQTYIRALQTLPSLSVHLGHFLVHSVRMCLDPPPTTGPKTAQVLKTEEKGSDVNLASFLLVDGFRNEYDQAVIISNDSDLKTPVAIVRDDLKKRVIILNPHPHPSRTLMSAATAYRQIRRGPLSASQFPTTITTLTGTIVKPASW